MNIHYASYLDALSIYSPQSSAYSIAHKNRLDWGNNRLPYGKVFKYLKKNNDLNGEILVNNGREVMQLYSYKYELRLNIYNNIDRTFEMKKNLIDFCRKNKIQYILVETGYYNMNILSSDWLGPDLLGEFNKGDFKPFSLIERFDHGVNALLLLQAPNI